MAAQKDIWKIIPFFVLPAVFFFLLGDIKWALISVGLIPLVFICWGLSALFSGKRLAEIHKHMTEEERQHFTEMAKRYGKKMGFFFAVPMGATYFILFYVIRLKPSAYYIIPFAPFLLIVIPLGLRFRKAMIRFALSTRYAKEKGLELTYSHTSDFDSGYATMDC